ncbi:MAG: DMT family transporter [Mangrovicoccus sp.]
MQGRAERQGAFYCLLAAMAWGTTGTAASFAPEVSAVAIGAAAMGFGGICQALWAGRGIWVYRRDLARAWPLLALGALAIAIYPLAFYGSMRLAGVTMGTVVSIGAAPICSAMIERAIDGRALSLDWAIGATLGLAGIACLAFGESSAGIAGADEQILPGIALGLLAAASYAFYSWVARRLMLGGLPTKIAMGACFGLGGLALMPVLGLSGAAFLQSWGHIAVGAYMALVPMFLGYLAFGAGLARAPVRLATTVTLAEPVVAAGLALLILGERLSGLAWCGVALVAACLLWTSWPKRRSGAGAPVGHCRGAGR